MDGHHGKITKDDIAGIVYTIYESIGKSVVVPYCGSKTINVRLTVSPDSKLKANDSVQVQTSKILKKQHLKSRKLFKSENDDEGSGSGHCDQNNEENVQTATNEAQQGSQRQSQTTSVMNNTVQPQSTENDTGKCEINCNNRVTKDVDTTDAELTSCTMQEHNLKKPTSQESLQNGIRYHRQLKSCEKPTENIYESAPIVENAQTNPMTASQRTPAAPSKCKNEKFDLTFNNNNATCCRDCRTTNSYQIDSAPFSKPSVRKLIRKSRSRKQKNTQETCPRTRLRSLSVGNENSYRNQRFMSSGGEAGGKERNEEYLNNLRRNDLIDIIRESMEKSRLCFQSNG